MKRSTIAAAMVILACGAGQALSAQTKGDPMVGTWKLNVAKSTFDPGPAPISTTYRYENLPDGSTLWASSGIGATGLPGFNFSIRRYDGRDYPTYNITSLTALAKDGDNTPNTTQASRLLDDRNTELFNKTDGVVTGKTTRTLARDGRSFTMKTYDPAGKLTSTQLFEKVDQPPTN